MAVNFVSSPPPPTSVSATAVQTVQKTASQRTRAGNGSFSPTDLLDDREGGRLLKDLVAVLASSRKQEVNKATVRSAICKSPDLMREKCAPDRVHRLAIASLNAATKEFSTLADQIITIADSSIASQHNDDDDHTNSNNTIVNEKEKTESHIYNKENDDITLDDSKTPSLLKPKEGQVVKRKNREVSIDNNAAAAAAAAEVCFPRTVPPVAGKETTTAARNEVTTIRDCINPRGGPLLEEKLDKLLDNVVKIKADMHQKIDRLSRRIDQIRLDVQLNIDTTDRAVCNNVLELVGIPYRKDENLQLYFRQICLLLGYSEANIPLVDIRRKRADRTLDKTEPTAAVSTAANRSHQTARSTRKRGEQSEDGLDCAIIVIEFVFKTIRDAFYRAYLKKRTVCLADIGLDSDRRIYVNETLTRMNQKLKSAALKKKREGLLHAVYTVDGEIFVQQQPGQKGRRITSVADLE